MTRKSLISHLNLSSLMVGAGCTIAGTAAAELHGNIEYIPAFMCLVFTVLGQMGANFYRRYNILTQQKGHKLEMRFPTHPVDYDTMILHSCAMACIGLAVMAGLAIITMSSWVGFFLGIAIFMLAWWWCGGPHPLCRTPWSLAIAFVLLGPICVMGTSLVQTLQETDQIIDWFDIGPSVYASMAMGLMAVNCNLTYNYVEHEYDLSTGRRSFTTVFGLTTARAFFMTNIVLMVLIMTFANLNLNLEHPWEGIVGLIPPAAMMLWVWWMLPRHRNYRQDFLTDICNFSVLLMGILLYIIANLSEYDDDSVKTFF